MTKTITKNFKIFFYWYDHDGGYKECGYYSTGLVYATMHYKNKHNKEFKDHNSWSDWTADDKFELEVYVKENPNYLETAREYKKLLELLKIEHPERASQVQTPLKE